MSGAPVVIDDEKLPCGDFLAFEELLKQWRVLDDKIVYELNTTIPTASFSHNADVAKGCEALYQRLTREYGRRERAINTCVEQQTALVERGRRLRQQERGQQSDEADAEQLARLRVHQSNVRLLQSEQLVEEVVRNRTIKAFYERCRNAYVPSHDKYFKK